MSGALDSSDLLLSYPTISLVLHITHITTILISTLKHQAFNKAKGFGREKDKEGEYSTVNDGEVFELVSDTTKGVSDGAWVLSASEGNVHEFAAGKFTF